jgi:sulfur-carrier protein
MTVRVFLPQALISLFPGCPSAPVVEGGTVSDAIDALNVRWPGLRHRLCDETPAIRRHINIFVGGERAGLDTIVPAGAEMVVMTAISGG